MTARVLSDALPFIQAHADRTVVIKYGGHAMEDEEASLSFAQDVVMLKQVQDNGCLAFGRTVGMSIAGKEGFVFYSYRERLFSRLFVSQGLTILYVWSYHVAVPISRFTLSYLFGRAVVAAVNYLSLSFQ